jgi:hypothetical protein
MIKGKAKAIKLGRMHNDGEIFCVEGEVYSFIFHEDDEYYEVEDEMDKLSRDDECTEVIFGHGMIVSFFDEHFDVIDLEPNVLKDVFKMIDDIFDNLDNTIFPQKCHCDKKACPMAVKVIDDSGEKIECRLWDYASPHLCLYDHENVSKCPYFQYRIKNYDA